MRIWIINHYALPPTTAGGTRHYNFARELIKRGHEVTIVAADFSHITHSVTPSVINIGKIDTSYDVPFIWIPTPAYKSNTIARFWNMLVFSFRLQRKKYFANLAAPDVIIGSSPHLFAAFSAQLLSRRFRKPFILEIRDLWPESLVDLGRFTNKHPIIKVMKFIESYLYQRATKIISLLPSVNPYLISYGIDANNILCLPNAIDIESIPNIMPVSSDRPFTIMYAGAHGIANDLDTLISAAKLLQGKTLIRPIKIFLVGEGPEKSRLQQRAANENLKNIEFLNAVAKNEIYNVMNKADVFLMLLKPSPVFRWGISPNKLFDYLAMARPVIFSVDTPFNPIEQCNAGISIQPGNPQALTDAIEQLSTMSSSELKAMGERGREYVIRQHCVKYLTDSLEKLLAATI